MLRSLVTLSLLSTSLALHAQHTPASITTPKLTQHTNHKLLSLRGGITISKDDAVLAYASVYGFFGTLLATIPETAFGANSPLCYWSTFGDAGLWFARALGATMLAFFLSPYYANVSADSLLKMARPLDAYFIGLFVWAATTVPAAKDAKNALLPFSLWWPQIGVGLTMLAINLMAK